MGRYKRWLIIGAVLVAVVVVARSTGLTAHLELDALRTWLTDAGPWGIALFLLAYALSNLVSVPALVFILAALVVYGGVVGGALAFFGGLLAATTSFFTVRILRGRTANADGTDETDKPRSARLERWLAPLDRRPVRTVALLRMVLMLSGPLNMALAASRIRYGAYLLGTAIGMVPPLVFYALTLDCWLPQ